MLLLSKGQTGESLGTFQKTALFRKSVNIRHTNTLLNLYALSSPTELLTFYLETF